MSNSNSPISVSGTTTGAEEEIRGIIKTATGLEDGDPFLIREIEIYTDVSTDLIINGIDSTYMAGITAITLTNGVTYNYKMALSGDQVNVTSLKIKAGAPVKWATTLIF